VRFCREVRQESGWAAALLSAGLALGCRPHPPRPVSVPVLVDIPPAVAVDEPAEPEPELGPGRGAVPKKALLGRWEGEGTQNDGQTWQIVLEVAGAGATPCARVSYPENEDWEISCAGTWDCDESSSPDTLRGLERIYEGSERCIDGCRFAADLAAGTVDFDCSQFDVLARATIHRAR
jgi:hypothetical protein